MASVEHEADDDTIRFYKASEKPYGAFSNLFRVPVEFDGVTYPTAEHAYQAAKPAKPEVREWLLAAPSPSLVAMAAHGLYVWDVVHDWAQIKGPRMKAVVLEKFHQHPELAKLLLSTGERRIAESSKTNNAVNRYWGEIKTAKGWVGRNELGLILMDVRGFLRTL